MDNLEKILEDMNTSEYYKKLNKWAKEYAKEYKTKEDIKQRKKEKMFSNTDYVNWLIKFTIKNNNGFSDDNWLYNPEDINRTDSEKVDDLQLFFEGIDEYAKSCNIDPIPFDNGAEYKLRINNTGLKIGFMVGQGSFVYCQKVNIKNENEFINFFDIYSNKSKIKKLKNNG